MLLSRRPILLTVALLLAVAGVGVWTTSASSLAAPTVYSYTVAGTDAHTLDAHLHLQFVAGGGVQVVDDAGAAHTGLNFIEVGLNLPVGAKVTSLAVSYRSCEAGPSATDFVFGSYAPATRATVQNLSFQGGTTCNPATLTKTGNPIAIAAAGRRYLLDVNTRLVSEYPGGGGHVFYGATIRYTCTSPCTP